MTEEDNRSQRAIEMASNALSRIESHEQICTIRQGQIINKLDGLEKTLARGLYAFIGMLILVIGYFLVHGGIPQVHP